VIATDVAEIVDDPAAVGRDTADALAPRPFWLHLDVDVLDEAAFPATDYLLPGGLDVDQLRDLLRPIGAHPSLVGASVACYSPAKDRDGASGRTLAGLLVDVLGGDA
jgi:arginase